MEKRRKYFYRFMALAGACTLVGLLLLPLLFQPSAKGYGTHHQLGLRPCNAIVYLGIPCPTCGCTTSFAHMARGNLLAAVKANLFGVLLYIFLFIWSLDLLVFTLTGQLRLSHWLLYNFNNSVKVAFGALILAWLLKLALWLS